MQASHMRLPCTLIMQLGWVLHSVHPGAPDCWLLPSDAAWLGLVCVRCNVPESCAVRLQV